MLADNPTGQVGMIQDSLMEDISAVYNTNISVCLTVALHNCEGRPEEDFNSDQYGTCICEYHLYVYYRIHVCTFKAYCD